MSTWLFRIMLDTVLVFIAVLFFIAIYMILRINPTDVYAGG